MHAHATARWILRDSARPLDEYEWETSDYKSHNPNYYLSDMYFTCDLSELDDAVLSAKQFLAALEENVLNHAREFGVDVRESPSAHFN
jgi:hypothetical protein